MLTRRELGALAISAACARPARAQNTAPAAFTTFQEAEPVLSWFTGPLPSGLEKPNQAKWNAWNRANDRAIRARLETGDLDSMVNLLLFGTSFTQQPRIRIEDLAEQAREGVLNARVADLVRGVAVPARNERLAILRTLLLAKGIRFDDSAQRDQAGVFILKNLTRVLEEKRQFAARSAAARQSAQADPTLAERSALFQDRGVSLDTGILADFSIDLALQRLKTGGGLRPGSISRVALIGPGLAFIDKDESAAFDYFPPQTVQPFAILDSLLRLDLARGSGLSLAALDISPLVLDHLQRARSQAAKGNGYVIQLPQDASRPWPRDLDSYWAGLGGRIGEPIDPLPPPAAFPGLKARAVKVRPKAVLECQGMEFDMVAQRLKLAPEARFDLAVATNVFLYYDRFQQALAVANVAAMLKSGGVLLANDDLPLPPSVGMRQTGINAISDGAAGRDAVAFYRKT